MKIKRPLYAIEGNRMIVESQHGFKSDVFEIVTEVPPGYEVWNIGNHHPQDWIPLCRLKAVQPFDGAREIETDTLKTIKAIDYYRQKGGQLNGSCTGQKT